MFRDQYAFKPTGSTTAALTYFMHQVTSLLEENNSVRCLLIDFSKAFNLPDCSTNVHNNYLLCVLCMVSYNFYLLLFHSVSIHICFCSSVVLVFLCCVTVLLLIAMSYHCPVCVRLSHSIKDYLITYLLKLNRYRHLGLQ